MHGMNILIDPVFSNHASPFPFPSMRRFSALPIKINDFDKIDIVVITHDHYDHLDYKTIKKIDKKVTRYIVPLGVEKTFRKMENKERKNYQFSLVGRNKNKWIISSLYAS